MPDSDSVGFEVMEMFSGPTANVSRDGIQATRVFKVVADGSTANISIDAVLRVEGLPRRGDKWASVDIGDSGTTDLYCQDVTAQHSEDLVWEVTASYTEDEPPEVLDSDDSDSNAEETVWYSYSSTSKDKPADRSFLNPRSIEVGDQTGDDSDSDLDYAEGPKYPIHTSAGKSFDPPLMRPAGAPQIACRFFRQLARWNSTADKLLSYHFTVNNQELTIGALTVPAYCGRIDSISTGDKVTVNGVEGYWVSITISISVDIAPTGIRSGFHDYVLDQ
jgi:hypothetical protein